MLRRTILRSGFCFFRLLN